MTAEEAVVTGHTDRDALIRRALGVRLRLKLSAPFGTGNHNPIAARAGGTETCDLPSKFNPFQLNTFTMPMGEKNTVVDGKLKIK